MNAWLNGEKDLNMVSEPEALNTQNLNQLLKQVASMSESIIREVQTIYADSIRQVKDTGAYDTSSVVCPASDIEASASVVPATIMFADLRDFTALVEEYPPNQVVCQLNEYFSVMTRIILAHGGILDKYMGDEIMAYFECKHPLEYFQAADQAVKAGIDMISALEQLNRHWRSKGWPELKCGIGINSGPVLKGNIGSLVKMETTVIGDTVNVASRLQQLSKTYNTCLLISGTTYKLVQDKFEVRSLGELSIRGKRNPVAVYEVAF